MVDVMKYGLAKGDKGELETFCTGAFLASDVLNAKSGRFVVYDISDGYWRAVNDGENKIGGYVQEHLTCSSTSGATKLPIFHVKKHVFELPYAAEGVAATLTQAVLDTLIGKLMDLLVASNIQYANNLASPSDNILRCVGGDVARNTLYVEVMDTAIGQIA